MSHSHCRQKTSPLSFGISSFLQKCFQSYIRYCCQSKNVFRTGNVFSFMDVVHTKLSSHIVYKFMSSCYYATYYGQTRRHFFVGASEYLLLLIVIGWS